MLRQWHALPGLFLALVLAVTAGTGAIIAGQAALDAATAPRVAEATISLAALAETITTQIPGVEKITRTPSGRVRVTYLDQGRPRSVVVDPKTGIPTATDTASPTLRMITNLHRAWLSGDGGRLVAGGAAFVMLLLCLSGLLMLKRMFGGWLALLRPFRGDGIRRWHLELGRFAVAGMLLSSVTGLHMSLVGFEILPDGATEDVFVTASGEAPRPLSAMDGLETLSLANLREITLPDPADASDPIIIRTDAAIRFVDAATGQVLREDRYSLAWHVRDIAYRLHTAEGMLWLAILLAISSAGGLVLALTGLTIGLRRRLASGRIRANAASETADILLLVGSEGGSTMRVAKALHHALAASGRRVHLAQMNGLPTRSPAGHMIILTATAGDGEAPGSASEFLENLARWQGARPDVMIVGFGDRQFPRFCGYADTVEAACLAHGFQLAMPTERIDRQSAEAVSRWVEQLAFRLDLPLQLTLDQASPASQVYRLIDREDYGAEVQAPTAILRFEIVPRFRWLPASLQHILGWMPRFEPGDLVAISPPSDPRPRFYSIASTSCSGILEICVRHQPGGICSGYLCGLSPGEDITATIRPNPAFRPDAKATSLILIGAGAGIAPLVGFVRNARPGRPVRLYWGGRDPNSDFLFRKDLENAHKTGRLTRLSTIFSRIRGGGYVQDLITSDAAELRAAVAAGGQILICGGRNMAEGVRLALAEALAPMGLDLPTLRQNGRLLEDVY
ncbi:MAG: PepSY domain-containing protein [Methylobacterium sp.]|nr:PepSY domain-containing protein [Cupriavidus sp.]MCA3654875.1 PepSY domain-containing protein [Methylobacterium sp.]MCA3656974.1 PepSY domain-containing protein [Methylobacterium sp.]MCA3663150.1 PepSY domain-containing protein [Methylobacterium sp.]MCA3678268.1 PepSY domain-containing protein [Methylobacterium sp.]